MANKLPQQGDASANGYIVNRVSRNFLIRVVVIVAATIVHLFPVSFITVLKTRSLLKGDRVKEPHPTNSEMPPTIASD